MIGELYNCNMISRRLLQRIYFDLMHRQTAQDLIALTQLTYAVNDRLINGPAKQFVKEEMHPSQKEAERRFGHMAVIFRYQFKYHTFRSSKGLKFSFQKYFKSNSFMTMWRWSFKIFTTLSFSH